MEKITNKPKDEFKVSEKNETNQSLGEKDENSNTTVAPEVPTAE